MFQSSVIMGTASVVVLLALQFAVVPSAQGLFFRSSDNNTKLANYSKEFGKKKFGDRLLFMDVIEKGLGFWNIPGFPVTENVVFPLPEETNNATISYISAVDKSKKGKGAHVTVYNGGIGHKNVTLRFQAQPWGKIYYIVQIYGQ